jgi:heterodisulfide reductase subunit A
MSDDPKQEEMRVGVYICHCGSNIAGVIPPGEVAEWASTLPGVVRATDTLYACADSGQTLIKEDIKKYNLNRVVVSACSVRMHETTFRGAVSEAVESFPDEMANIREQCVGRRHDKEARCARQRPDSCGNRDAIPGHPNIKVPVASALVIGGGVSGTVPR